MTKPRTTPTLTWLHRDGLSALRDLDLPIPALVRCTLHTALVKALADGQSLRTFERAITPAMAADGWTITRGQTAPGEHALSRSCLHAIYDTVVRIARAAEQWERIQRTKETLPYLLYCLGPSQTHFPSHESWQGVLLPVDDFWWQTHFPPNGWGCRCWVRSISTLEYRRTVADGVELPDEPILDPKTGRPTGHITTKRKPAITTAPIPHPKDWLHPYFQRIPGAVITS